MENGVIEKLASSGLDSFELPVADVESRGTNPETVESACSTLEAESKSIEGFKTELETTKTQLLMNWSGNSAENFAAQFPQLIEAFDKIPVCITSIANWAQEVKEAYVKIDQASF